MRIGGSCMDRQLLYDRIAGCLMAGALGDALGYEVEFLSWNSIQHRFGGEGIQALVPHQGKARFSDDTQMTLFTNEGMVLGLDAASAGTDEGAAFYVHQAYLCWLMTQGTCRALPRSVWEKTSALLRVPELNVPRAPGNTCLSALESGRMGTVNDPINHSKGCGGVMRTAPAGFIRSWGSPLHNGAAFAAITHGHPGGWAPAGMLSDIVSRLICDPPRPLEQVVLDSLDAAQAAWDLPAVRTFADMIRQAIRLSHADVPDVEAIHSLGGGWVGDEALAIAVYSCLKHPGDVRAALISAANHSGDSDSTAAIAGNILGAQLGLRALPGDWIAQLELTDVILDQAEKMTQAVMGSLQR